MSNNLGKKLVLKVNLLEEYKQENAETMLRAGKEGYDMVLRPLSTDDTMFLISDDDLRITSLNGTTVETLEQSFVDLGYEVKDLLKW